MKRVLCILGIAFSCSAAQAAPEIPGPPQNQPIAITQATIYRISNAVMENATILFEDGRITGVGRDVELPANTLVIDGRA